MVDDDRTNKNRKLDTAHQVSIEGCHTRERFYRRQLVLVSIGRKGIVGRLPVEFEKRSKALREIFHYLTDGYIRIPGHHRILQDPSSHCLNRSVSNSHFPVPAWCLLKMSFCLAQKLRGNIHATRLRVS
jgi:hypothetical protein